MKRPRIKQHKTISRPISEARQGFENLIIEALLGNPHLFQDGPPRWREGQANRPCQTSVQSAAERERLVKRLRRFGAHDPAATDLAQRLADCSTASRCLSASCPECSRAFQRMFVSATGRFLAQRGSYPTGSTIVSPMSATGQVEPRKLHS